MKTAHIKTVDGTTTMIQVDDIHLYHRFQNFLHEDSEYFTWVENNGMEVCYLYRKHIISVRFREVE